MILSVGSTNADFVVRVDRLPSGSGALAAHDLLRTSGGKAANVAFLGARLGATASLYACVGEDDLAEQALAGPLAAGVDVSGVLRRPTHTAYTSILVPPDGAKRIVLEPGANEAWADAAGWLGQQVGAAPRPSVVVVDLEVPVEVARTALEAARDRGLTTVLDPAPPERGAAGLLALADLVTPDDGEAEALTGIAVHDEASGLAAADELVRKGARGALVKLPEGGCAAAAEEGHRFTIAPPSDLEVVDATGAGDAFAGALAWALHDGRDLRAAARTAVAASACAVTGYGSQESYPDGAGLEAMLGRTAEAIDA